MPSRACWFEKGELKGSGFCERRGGVGTGAGAISRGVEEDIGLEIKLGSTDTESFSFGRVSLSLESALVDPPRRFLAVVFGISAEVIGVGVEGREDSGKKGVVSPDAASSSGMSFSTCSTSSSSGAMKGEVDGETIEKGEEIAMPWWWPLPPDRILCISKHASDISFSTIDRPCCLFDLREELAARRG